jgi:hypothetical protein
MVPPCFRVRPLAAWRAGPTWRHAQMRATFIDDDELMHIQRGDQVAKSGPRRLIALDGPERFF